MRRGVFFRGGITFTQVIVLAILVSGSAPAPALARPSAPLVPSSGALLGAWVDPGSGWSRSGVADFESRIGRKIDIDHHYYAWGDSFPGQNEVFDRDSGRIPLLTWEPWGTTLSEIAGGSYDSLIRTRARAVAAFASPVFLRLAHEMNGNWYPWDGSHNGGDPSRYVAAWRRVHDLFASEGATNAVWVWSPNAEDVPAQAWNRFSNYYPGDSYVDWVGVDGYNFGTTEAWGSWRSFEAIFGRIYSAYAGSKPIMIAETGSAEQGGSKASWLLDAWYRAQVRMPSIAAFVAFDAGKWRIETSSAATAAFRLMAASPHMNQSPDSGAPRLSGPASNPTQVRSSTKVWFRAWEPAKMSVRVLDSQARVVRVLRNWTWSAPVGAAAYWDTRDSRGRKVAAGSYRLLMSAVDSAGNRRYASQWIRVSR
ncbi:MAG: hypothetical protein HY775_05120 [Acidobacteria bacterium]|nr:hypothetical protein [Acidobacteriota bacterium]